MPSDRAVSSTSSGLWVPEASKAQARHAGFRSQRRLCSARCPARPNRLSVLSHRQRQHVIFPLAVVDFSCVVLAPATPISPVVDPFSSVHIAVCKLELALRKPCRCVRKFRNNSRRSNWRGKRSAGESVDVQILPSGPAATFQNRRLLQDTRMCLCPRAGRASIHPRTEAAR
jgi:hypothetical protein